MVTKAQFTYIKALQHQKERRNAQAFVVEGPKLAIEWLASAWHIKTVFAITPWLVENDALLNTHKEAVVVAVTQQELGRLSAHPSPNLVVMEVAMPLRSLQVSAAEDWLLALHDIQDPGNMGTLMRIADWYGIGHIVASPACADAFHPKVLNSAMGAQLRVTVHQVDLEEFLPQQHRPIIAATLNGENVYEFEAPKQGVLLIGNEGQGLTAELQSLAERKVTIPSRGGAESLNAAVSAGILLSHFFCTKY